MNRRSFVAGASALAATGAAAQVPDPGTEPPLGRVPPHLKGYESLYAQDPRQAALAWFRDARFGLFMHFGISSLLGKGEWVMLHDVIPIPEYEQLAEQFNPTEFDADVITDLALGAGMKYVTITARHHDSFCLFDTVASDYHVLNTPAKRDLIGELAEACAAKGVGLFLYYSMGADWWHPFFYPRTFWGSARPAYKEVPEQYRWQRDEDFVHYLNFAHTQLTELLTQYGDLAGIWLDPIMGYYARPDLFPLERTYALIRSIQPHALISFKQGATGDEDFMAPERQAGSLEVRVRKLLGEQAADVARRAWEKNRGKPREYCNTLQEHAWGWNKAVGRRSVAEVREMLAHARENDANLLLNTGPLPDGSIHPEDVAVLRALRTS